MIQDQPSVWPSGALRQAGVSDVAAIEQLVHSAYAKYIPRIGRKPKPMLADYHHALAHHQMWVVADDSTVLAVLELIPDAGFLLIENIAVQPSLQKSGYGYALMRFAEDQAHQQGFAELRLYTNEKFTENIRFYSRVGYRETHREPYLGSSVVHMAKQL